MKKVKIVLTALALTLVLAGCSLTNNNSAQSTSTESTNDYIVKVTDATELSNVINNNALIFFYANSTLGNDCLDQISSLANEYKIKVYVIDISSDAKFLKNTTDTNMQAVYAKLGDKASFLKDGVTIVIPNLFDIESGQVKTNVSGVAIEKFDINNISPDDLNAIKESYRPLFESQK